MNDLISRQAAIEAIQKNTFRLTFAEEQGCKGHVAWSAKAVYSDVIEGALLELPPVNPQKIGHWISLNTGKPSRIKDGIPTESVRCSECDEWLTASDEYACKGNYCPNCGCRMVEPQESEEV